MNIEIVGSRTAGKTTIGKAISEEFGISYISLGQIARSEIKNQTELGKQMQWHIENKIIYPEGFLVEIIENQLEKTINGKGFVLDGYPRRSSEAVELVEILKRLNTNLDFIFNINISLEEAKKRSFERLICPSCDYQGNNDIHICPHCAHSLTKRNDDVPEEIERMHKLHRTEIKSMIGILSGITLTQAFTINGEKTPNFVVNGIIHLINQQITN